MNTTMDAKTKMPTGRRYTIKEVREEFMDILKSAIHKDTLLFTPTEKKEHMEEVVEVLEHVAISYAKECYTEDYTKIRKEYESHREELLAEFKTNREDWFEKKQSLLDELASEQEANRHLNDEISNLRDEIDESEEVVGIVERMEDEIKFLRSALMAHATNEGKR